MTEPACFSTRQLAERWGVSENSVRQLAKDGTLPYHHPTDGRAIRFLEKDVIAHEKCNGDFSPMNHRKHYVYFVGAPDALDENGAGLVKIGMTYDIERRFRLLRNGCPVTLRLWATVETPDKASAVALEASLHAQFDAYRHHGEWFKVTPHLRRLIVEHREKENA